METAFGLGYIISFQTSLHRFRVEEYHFQSVLHLLIHVCRAIFIALEWKLYSLLEAIRLDTINLIIAIRYLL